MTRRCPDCQHGPDDCEPVCTCACPRPDCSCGDTPPTLVARLLRAWREARPTREALIAAQVDIFRNQDDERDAGITWETDEYHRLHRAYYDLERDVPWWVRFGTWDQALYRHGRETDRDIV